MEEIKTFPIITYAPYNTVKLTLTAKIYDEDNDKFAEAVMDLGMEALREAMIDGDQWEAENVKYVFTDKGKKELGLM